jgi:hypothetical protein
MGWSFVLERKGAFMMGACVREDVRVYMSIVRGRVRGLSRVKLFKASHHRVNEGPTFETVTVFVEGIGLMVSNMRLLAQLCSTT